MVTGCAGLWQPEKRDADSRIPAMPKCRILAQQSIFVVRTENGNKNRERTSEPGRPPVSVRQASAGDQLMVLMRWGPINLLLSITDVAASGQQHRYLVCLRV